MPFVRPTRTQLVEDARTALETRLPGSDARLRRSMLDVLARILAELANGLYGFLAYIARQAFADTADVDYLRRFGALYGVPEIPAGFAQGVVIFTGSELATIPANTAVRRVDGREYVTLTEGSISSGTAEVSVLSTTAGLDANTDAGVTLSLLSPLSGVSSAATVDSDGITGGTDVESVESLRSRIVARIQRPPAGGTIADYIARAKEYPGVTDVFVYAPLVLPDPRMSIASVTVDSLVSGVWSAKGTSKTVRVILAFLTGTLSNGETVTFSGQLEDATSSGGAGAANFGSAIAPVVVGTAVGAVAVSGQHSLDVDIQTARAFLRAKATLATSGAGTLVAWSVTMEYLGGPGDVGIAPMFYDRTDPFPLAADLVNIQGLMDAPEFKPAGSTPIVYALTATAQAFTISITPDSTAMRAAIEAELVDLFRREAEPGGVILLSHIREALSQTAGETDYVLTVPSANVNLASDRTLISTVGTITWV